MIDIGPRLDSRLRDKFDRFEAEAPPQRLTSFQPTTTRRRHRSLNVMAGAAAIAVVAGAAGVFALELSGHPHPLPAPSSAQGGPLPKMPDYSPAPPLPHVISPTPLPDYGTGFPASWYTAILLTRHTGSAVLPAFIPEGWVYVQYACIGPGHLQIVTSDATVNEKLRPCSSAATPVDAGISLAYGPLSGAPVALKIVTSSSVRWEIIVAETAKPLALPALPPLPAGAKILVPLTFGQGIAALPSFTHHSFNTMEWWCSGPGGMQVFVSNGDESTGSSACGLSGAGGSDDYLGKRETLVVDVNPDNRWEILVYWEPNASGG
jgi:hypothetical protein